MFSRGRVTVRHPVRPSPPRGYVGMARAFGLVLRLVRRCGELEGRARAGFKSRVALDGPRRGLRSSCSRGARADEHPDCAATPYGRMARSAIPAVTSLGVWRL